MDDRPFLWSRVSSRRQKFASVITQLVDTSSPINCCPYTPQWHVGFCFRRVTFSKKVAQTRALGMPCNSRLPQLSSLPLLSPEDLDWLPLTRTSGVSTPLALSLESLFVCLCENVGCLDSTAHFIIVFSFVSSRDSNRPLYFMVSLEGLTCVRTHKALSEPFIR